MQNLRYAIDHKALVTFMIDRRVDAQRNPRYTNKFTIVDLFGEKDIDVVLKRELKKLTVENYIQTVKDFRYPERSEMREYGIVYQGKGDVYCKIRVELLSVYGSHKVFVMSFHYAETPFTSDIFPYKRH